VTIKEYEYGWTVRSIHTWLTSFDPVEPGYLMPTDGMEAYERNERAKEMNWKRQKQADLLNGRWQQYFASQSEADQSLCNFLAWASCCDIEIMDTLFRASGLYRPEKWNRNSYRNPTMLKAIEAVQIHERERYARLANPDGARQKDVPC
jgi:primase/DNA polymerase family protein